MSLRDRLKNERPVSEELMLETFGVSCNPFPSSNQTTGHPHFPIPADGFAEEQILQFLERRDSHVLVVLGTQGVGKTNFLNHIQSELEDVRAQIRGYYLVRYMADPEASFDGIVRAVFEELGVDHLRRVAASLGTSKEPLSSVRSYDLRSALLALSENPDDEDLFAACLDWLFGLRLLNIHRTHLNVNFRLDTVESRTAVLRDYILVSAELGALRGVFLLLDELEKQAGVLGARAVVRYLSALRAIIDSLARHLFLVVAVTPDAMRRYSTALPALRSRLENQIVLSPLSTVHEAIALADFYMGKASKGGSHSGSQSLATRPYTELVSHSQIEAAFLEAASRSSRRGDDGVRQREFLNSLHSMADQKIEDLRQRMGLHRSSG